MQAAWRVWLFDSQKIPNSSISLIGISPFQAPTGTSTNATIPSLLLSPTVHTPEEAEENTRTWGSLQEPFSFSLSFRHLQFSRWLSAQPQHSCLLSSCSFLLLPPHLSEKAILELSGQFVTSGDLRRIPGSKPLFYTDRLPNACCSLKRGLFL